MLFTYLTKPFKVFNVTPDDMVGDERVTVVDSLAAAQLTAAYGIRDKIHIGAKLPLIFSLSGDGLDAPTGGPALNGLSVTGLGDLLVEGKIRLYKKNKLRAAALAGVSLPTSFGSDDSQFIGDNLQQPPVDTRSDGTTTRPGRHRTGPASSVATRTPSR